MHASKCDVVRAQQRVSVHAPQRRRREGGHAQSRGDGAALELACAPEGEDGEQQALLRRGIVVVARGAPPRQVSELVQERHDRRALRTRQPEIRPLVDLPKGVREVNFWFFPTTRGLKSVSKKGAPEPTRTSGAVETIALRLTTCIKAFFCSMYRIDATLLHHCDRDAT